MVIVFRTELGTRFEYDEDKDEIRVVPAVLAGAMLFDRKELLDIMDSIKRYVKGEGQ